MKKMTFEAFIKANAQVVEEIRHTAWNLHESVGQTYDKNLPYGHHLSMKCISQVLGEQKTMVRIWLS